MSAVLAQLPVDYAERDEALRQLRIWNNQVPNVIKDAVCDLPDGFLKELAEVVESRIVFGLRGDTADLGAKLAAHIEALVRESVRRELA